MRLVYLFAILLISLLAVFSAHDLKPHTQAAATNASTRASITASQAPAATGCSTLSFRTAPHIAVIASAINDVAAADFTGDGNADAAVAHPAGLTLLPGDGKGDFGAPIPITVAGEPQKLFKGDFNGDGRVDLLSVGKTASALLLNASAGSFQIVALTALAEAKATLVSIGDFNGDKRSDLLVRLNANSLGKLAVLLNAPTGFLLGAELNSGDITKAVTGDFNSDGRDDVAFYLRRADYGPATIELRFSNADGTFRSQTENTRQQVHGLISGDFDGDGRRDLAYSMIHYSSSDSNGVILLNRAGRWDSQSWPRFYECSGYIDDNGTRAGNNPPVIAAGDFDGDKKDDVAFGSGCSGNLLLFVNGERHDFGIPGNVYALSDFNGDGRTDFLLSSLRKENGAAYFSKMLSNAAGSYDTMPALGSDGALAITGGDYFGTGKTSIGYVKVFSNFGNQLQLGRHGDFLHNGLSLVSDSLWSGDVNQDGFDDLLLSDRDWIPRSLFFGYSKTNGGQTLRLGLLNDRLQPEKWLIDLTNDGQADLVMRNRFVNPSDATLIYLNDGYGNFQLARTYPAVQPQLAADFNNDQHGDLIVSTNETKLLWLGRGDGTFNAINLPALDAEAILLHAADLNGDQNVDLVVQAADRRLLVFAGRGDGTFDLPLEHAVPARLTRSEWTLTADLNHDGLPDLASATGNAIFIFPNLGNGRFGSAIWLEILSGGHWVQGGPGGLIAGDLDGDGKTDLAYSKGGWYYYAFYNTSECIPHRSFRVRPQTISREQGSGTQRMRLATLDFPSALPSDYRVTVNAPASAGVTLTNVSNNNGVITADVAVACNAPVSLANLRLNITSASGTDLQANLLLRIMPNQPPYLNYPARIERANTQPITIAGANLDLSLVQDRGAIRELTLSAPSLPDSTIDTTAQNFGRITVPASVAAGTHRLTVTAKDDCGATSTAQIELTITGPPPCPTTFRAQPELAVSGNPAAIVTADFNGDGRNDLATVSNGTANGLSVLLNDGAGGWRTAVSYPFSVAAGSETGLIAGDFNGDRWPDLAALDGANGRIHLFLNRGGTFAAAQTFPTGASSTALVAADFNLDGKLDVATANFFARTVSVLLGDGADKLATALPLSVSQDLNQTPYALAAGDADGDGDADLAVALWGVGIVLLDNDGTGKFGVARTADGQSANTSNAVRHLAFADLNADGRPDLLALAKGSPTGALYVLLNRGSGQFGGDANNSFLFPTQSQPVHLAVVDVELDGKLDVVTANEADQTSGTNPSPTLSLLRGDGTGRFAAAQAFTNTGTNNSGARQVAIGDFTGDGRPDLASANAQRASVTIFRSFCTNVSPVITPVATTLTRQQGSAGTTSTIATVSDAQISAGALTVTATNVPAGLSVTDITNTNGTITAIFATACGAPLGPQSITLAVTNGVTMATANVTVNVTANTPPILGAYGPVTRLLYESLSHAPSAPPSDNGSLLSVTASASSVRDPLLVNPATGIVTHNLLAPAGTHFVTVRATDNCQAVSTTSFSLLISLLPTRTSVSVRPLGENVVGQPFLLSATVIAAAGQPQIPLRGSFRFFDGDEEITGTPQATAAGTLDLLTTNLKPGLRNITARYSGDDDLAASTSMPVSFYVNHPLTSVSAASFSGTALAAEQIVAAFGMNLAATTQAAVSVPLPTALAGVTVTIQDSTGAQRLAPLFFVSPNQVNYLLPANTATGAAVITLSQGSERAVSLVTIAPTAPSVFTASATGRGLAAAQSLRVLADGTQRYEPIARYDEASKQFVALPIDLSNASEQVFLVLYGTGIRGRSTLAGVTTTIGGTACETLYAGAQGALVGLDQVNVRLPRSLAGRGEVDVAFTADGKAANVVKLKVK